MVSTTNRVKSLLASCVLLAVGTFVYLEFGSYLNMSTTSVPTVQIKIVKSITPHGNKNISGGRQLTQYNDSIENDLVSKKSTMETEADHEVRALELQDQMAITTYNSSISIPPPPMLNKPPPNLPWFRKGLKVTPATLMYLPWVDTLWRLLYLEINPNYPVAITSSNFEYRSSLLNWLAHALIKLGNNSVKNIVVVCMDKQLHNFLQKRQILSLLVDHQSLSRVSGKKNKQGILMVEIARLVVMRLINFWGYDVVNYDTDALILKNPQELFDLYPQSQVIGSESYMPYELHKQWGVTLCMGAILIRASPETELLWSTMSKFDVKDDQKKINYALNNLKIKFDRRNTTTNDGHSLWQGVASLVEHQSPAILNVTVLPMRTICRGEACTLSIIRDCYVWHKGGRSHSFKDMKKKASQAKVWLLQENWLKIGDQSNLIGKNWIRLLMKKF